MRNQKNRNKIFAAAMAAAVVMSLAGCSGSAASSAAGAASPAASAAAVPENAQPKGTLTLYTSQPVA